MHGELWRTVKCNETIWELTDGADAEARCVVITLSKESEPDAPYMAQQYWASVLRGGPRIDLKHPNMPADISPASLS